MLGALTLYSSTLQEYSDEQKKLLDEAARLLASALSRNTGQILESERRLEASDAQTKTDLRVSQLNPASTVVESKFSH